MIVLHHISRKNRDAGKQQQRAMTTNNNNEETDVLYIESKKFVVFSTCCFVWFGFVHLLKTKTRYIK